MKRKYMMPQTEVCALEMERQALVAFSQVDNNGDGITDQRPIIEGDPDGGIGAKKGWIPDEYGDGTGKPGLWEDWHDS